MVPPGLAFVLPAPSVAAGHQWLRRSFHLRGTNVQQGDWPLLAGDAGLSPKPRSLLGLKTISERAKLLR
jgi:hypothetical protein